MQTQTVKIDLAVRGHLVEKVMEDLFSISLALLLSTLFAECWLQYGTADVRLVETVEPSRTAVSRGCMFKWAEAISSMERKLDRTLAMYSDDEGLFNKGL